VTGAQNKIRRAAKEVARTAEKMVSEIEQASPDKTDHVIDFWHAILKEKMRLVSYEKRQHRSILKIKSKTS
jgi:hypothetical protein